MDKVMEIYIMLSNIYWGLTISGGLSSVVSGIDFIFEGFLRT